ATLPRFISRGLSLEQGKKLLEKSVKLTRDARDVLWKTVEKIGDHSYNRALVAASVGSYGAYLADGSEYRVLICSNAFVYYQIHWSSIFNSFMMVIFLTGLVSMILMRTLRNDYAKYAREDDVLETLERDVSEECGWKLVHGDVLWLPRNLVLLLAVVGT
nr:transmembrane 9 superfamily member 1-like [Tanacetum cinerariifolium]